LQTVYDVDGSERLSHYWAVLKLSDRGSDLTIDQFYRDVGAKIREIRLRRRAQNKNLTQEALAESVGLTRTSLTNIEKGRQRILLHTFTKIASALEVPAQQLLPETSTVLASIGVELPAELPADELGFIQRAMSPEANYAHLETKRNSRLRKPSPRRK